MATQQTVAAQTAKPQKKRPWRKLVTRNSKYFCVDDLGDRTELTVKIERVDEDGELGGFFSGKSEKTKAPMLHFVGIEKPFGAKSTNCRALTKLLGSKYPIDWQGKIFTFVVVEVDTRDGPTDSLRIKPQRATEAMWLACQKGYKAPPFDLETCLASFKAARTPDELDSIKSTLRAVPKEHHETLKAAYEKRMADLHDIAGDPPPQDEEPEDEGSPL